MAALSVREAEEHASAPAREPALSVCSWILVRTTPGPMMKKLASSDSASSSSHILISMIFDAV